MKSIMTIIKSKGIKERDLIFNKNGGSFKWRYVNFKKIYNT